jgi:XTP/dITP diphosphohydrolase
MKTILFATGNGRKLAEAQAACKDFGIEIQQAKLDIIEVQSHDPQTISAHKATQAFELVKAPVVVTDTSWNIPGLKGFPGGYLKDVSAWFEPEDWLALMAAKTDRRISFTETIIYTDATQTKTFSKKYWGEIVTKPRGIGESIEQVAEFEGHTLGERRAQGTFIHDPKDYVWYVFAKWLDSTIYGICPDIKDGR